MVESLKLNAREVLEYTRTEMSAEMWHYGGRDMNLQFRHLLPAPGAQAIQDLSLHIYVGMHGLIEAKIRELNTLVIYFQDYGHTPFDIRFERLADERPEGIKNLLEFPDAKFSLKKAEFLPGSGGCTIEVRGYRSCETIDKGANIKIHITPSKAQLPSQRP